MIGGGPISPKIYQSDCEVHDGNIMTGSHDCIVNVQEGQHTYHYRVFFKHHRRLRFN
jgi:hypothetical protein